MTCYKSHSGTCEEIAQSLKDSRRVGILLDGLTTNRKTEATHHKKPNASMIYVDDEDDTIVPEETLEKLGNLKFIVSLTEM